MNEPCQICIVKCDTCYIENAFSMQTHAEVTDTCRSHRHMQKSQTSYWECISSYIENVFYWECVISCSENVFYWECVILRMHLNADTCRSHRLIHMCDMTHSCTCRDSFICVTWLIHVCRGSFICVTWHIYVCDLTHSYVWHDSYWFKHAGVMSYVSNMCDTTDRYTTLYVRRDSFICVTYSSICTPMYDMTPACLGQFICVIWISQDWFNSWMTPACLDQICLT